MAETLTINGTSFLSSSTVTYKGTAHTATLVNSTQLTISLTASDQARAGTYAVVVTNPLPGGGASNSVNFTVNNPVPSITTLSPSSATAGAAAQTLTINGADFLSSSTVTYNGAAHATTFVSSTQLTISLSVGDQATGGTYVVVATNPSPGGGPSNAVNFTVAGSGSLDISVTGLPEGLAASVSVTGPGGYVQTLTATTTLMGLLPGTYNLTAAIVPGSLGSNAVYIPTITKSDVTVTVGQTSSTTVSYQALSTTWQPIGPDAISSPGGLPAAGKLQAFAVNNVNPLVMYAGGGVGQGTSGPYTQAGIYKTVDGGKTWTQTDVGLSDTVVDALWLNQSNPNVLLAGTQTLSNYSSTYPGIFLSTDAGAHWAPVASLGIVTGFLQVGSTLYAATSQGVAQSNDGGMTWATTEPTSPPVRVLAAGGGALYAGLDNGQVLVKINSNSSWVTTTPTTSPSVTASSITVNPSNPQVAYVVEFVNYEVPDLYETANGRTTWTPLKGLGCAAQFVAVQPSSPSTVYAGCDGGLNVSSDGGQTWSTIPGTGWDIRLIVPDAAGVPGSIVLGSDQGLYEMQSAGPWTSLNGNITSSILFGLDVSASTILTTAQDFSPISTFDGGASWQVSEGGDAGEAGSVVFNPGNPAWEYVFTVAGLQYSSDGGHTFQTVGGPQFSAAQGNGDLIAVDQLNPSTVYVAATNGFYKSTDWGVSWTLQNWPVSQPTLVAVDPSDSMILFAGSATGALMFTHDGGVTWTASSLAGANGPPASLAVDPSNSKVVLLGMASGPAFQNSTVVVRSTDGGATFTGSDAGISLQGGQCQNAAVSHIRFDPSGSGLITAATFTGLYLSSDLGTTWVNVRGNAVPSAFTDVRWSNGALYASTCGEGVLRMPFAF